jgi:DNA-binding transcriptional ArsR family regulator
MSSRSDKSTGGRTFGSAIDSLTSESSLAERVRRRMPADATVSKTAGIFSALADPTRLRILDALATAELCVGDLAEVCGISQSGVSHQLKLLRDRKLVDRRRSANRCVYRLVDDHVRELLVQGLAHAAESSTTQGAA